MPQFARKDIVIEGEVGIYHCTSRCVRRAFLCGEDPVSGRDLGHRKDWIRDRLKLLVEYMAVECDCSILSNHIHVVVRTRRLKEWVARRANAEDRCKGRFWEGRFKCQALVDDAAVLACSMYVDLNPIRARIAETPEESEYTSAKDRIDGRKTRRRTARNKRPRDRRRKGIRPAADDWLCPILSEAEIRTAREHAKTQQTCTRNDAHPVSAATPSPSFLPMGVDDYLRLLDWSGRQIRDDKPGSIRKRLAPSSTASL